MPVSTPYKPLDLFKVAKFIARISGAKEIGEPPFQVALDFFKPLDAEDSQRQTIPGELPTATQVILSAHDSFPTMPLSDAMRQKRKDMEQKGTQFEVVDNAVLPSDLNAGFVRQLVRGMEQASQSEWDATLDRTLESWGCQSEVQQADREWAKRFADSLFNYLRGNPYKLYDAPQAPPPSLTPAAVPGTHIKPSQVEPALQPAELRNPYTKALSEQVLGQPLALRRFDETLLMSAWMPNRQGRPETFLLAGPSATGKSTFAQALRAEWVLRGGEHISIDLSSMRSHNEGFGLIGLRAGYDSAGPGRLTSFVQEHPDALVVLENVTLAHPNVQALLIPLLTTGTLADEYGFGAGADRGQPRTREVSFAQATVLMTCTVGEEVFEQPANLKRYASDPNGLVALLKDAMDNLTSDGARSHTLSTQSTEQPSPLVPYLRQVNMLPFRPLNLEALEQIALVGLSDVEQALANKQVTISWGNGYGGARQQLARILALSSAPQFSPLMVRQLAADTILRQWLYQNPNLAGVQNVTVSLDETGLTAIDLCQEPEVLQREFFRRSQRLAFSVTAQGPQQLLVGDIRVDRVPTHRDYGVEGGLAVEVPQLRFKDIFGHDVIKDRLAEVVHLLKDTSPRNELSLPRGMLLHGQPGTGKTMLAKALASEAGLPFIAASGPQLLQIDTIRDIFRRARQYAPCLVFLDEIDALGVRGRGGLDPCINQLLVEIDGFKAADEGHVFVIAATNFRNKIDPALTRSGRLDLCLEVPLLDRDARRHFLEKLQSETRLKAGEPFPMDELLELSAGMSGADLDKLVREVQLTAIRRGLHEVTPADLLEELNVIKHGARLDNPPLRAQMAVTAHHEAGHAVVSRALNPDVRIEQVTIVPRRNALGFTAYSEESFSLRSFDRQEVMDLICVALGGRVAQRKYMAQLEGDQALDKGSDAGAESDLRQATRLAWQAITAWGLDTEFGWVSTQPWSDDAIIPASLEERATQRVKAWIDEARARTEQVVETNWHVVRQLAEGLLTEEMILGEKLASLLKGAQA